MLQGTVLCISLLCQSEKQIQNKKHGHRQHPGSDEKRSSGVLHSGYAHQWRCVSDGDHRKDERSKTRCGGRNPLSPAYTSEEHGTPQLSLGRIHIGTTTQILQTHSGRKTIPERIGKYLG